MIKKIIHIYLISVLTSKGGLEKNAIDEKKKTISLGLYGINGLFFETKHKSAISLLTSFFGYQCYQKEFKLQQVDIVVDATKYPYRATEPKPASQ